MKIKSLFHNFKREMFVLYEKQKFSSVTYILFVCNVSMQKFLSMLKVGSSVPQN
jgi:hypothetical protein